MKMCHGGQCDSLCTRTVPQFQNFPISKRKEKEKSSHKPQRIWNYPSQTLITFYRELQILCQAKNSRDCTIYAYINSKKVGKNFFPSYVHKLIYIRIYIAPTKDQIRHQTIADQHCASYRLTHPPPKQSRTWFPELGRQAAYITHSTVQHVAQYSPMCTF